MQEGCTLIYRAVPRRCHSSSCRPTEATTLGTASSPIASSSTPISRVAINKMHGSKEATRANNLSNTKASNNSITADPNNRTTKTKRSKLPSRNTCRTS